MKSRLRRRSEVRARAKALNDAINQGADPEVIRILVARIASRRQDNVRQLHRSLSPKARAKLRAYPGDINLGELSSDQQGGEDDEYTEHGIEGIDR